MAGPFARLRERLASPRAGSDDPLERSRKMLRRWRKRGRDWPSRPYYPAILDIAGRRALIVGAGEIGEGKIDGLLKGGAKVKVISKSATANVQRLAREGQIDLDLRPYETSDLDGCFLVIAATEDNSANVRVFEDAEQRQMLCNVVDVTHLCNFILPSIVRRGDLAVAVSTGGASPAMARRIRIDIGQRYGDEYEAAMKILGALRGEFKMRYPAPADRKVIFERIVYSDFMRMVREGDTAAIEAWVETCIEEGPNYTSAAEHRAMIEAALSFPQAQ
ncbi:MAG: bifunctional precorrin-2 dehydrogenase/sirohydrochlorin ferrochelatase [Solirubrobacterales bacterium]